MDLAFLLQRDEGRAHGRPRAAQQGTQVILGWKLMHLGDHRADFLLDELFDPQLRLPGGAEA